MAWEDGKEEPLGGGSGGPTGEGLRSPQAGNGAVGSKARDSAHIGQRWGRGAAR